MKTIYLDSEYMCHLTNDGTMAEIQTEMFDDIENAAVEYYRYIPEGSEWTNLKSGLVIHGLFIQATDSNRIDEIQREAYIEDMQNALNILGVNQ